LIKRKGVRGFGCVRIQRIQREKDKKGRGLGFFNPKNPKKI
ncbi:unnamed protein product, partial [marine sediment metagenome]